MDLRHYYAAVRLIEDQIQEQDVLVVSEATPDGGKAGVFCEVSRHAGARLVVEQKARLATAEEQSQFRMLRPADTTAALNQNIPPFVVDTATTKQSAVPRARKG